MAPCGARLVLVVTEWSQGGKRRMTDWDAPISEELSTLSTPPTVRTSVETEEQANASSSGASTSLAREEGESERGKPSGPVDSAWARALMSIEACKREVCAYKNPDAPR